MINVQDRRTDKLPQIRFRSSSGVLRRSRPSSHRMAGTHQGGVSHEHLPYYLDEFTFRFNRRKSKSRGKLFFRLVQQAAETGPTTYAHIAKPAKLPRTK